MRSARAAAPALLSVTLALAACGGTSDSVPSATTSATTDSSSASGSSSASAAATSPHAPASSSAPAHWTYEGAEGPAQWAHLDPSYATCADGDRQSPIDIAGARDADLPTLRPDYRTVPLTVWNTGHTQQVVVPAGSTLRLGDATYTLLQAHLHTPSEHTIGGRPADGELHLVHRDSAGRLAVVGVLLRAGGQANAALAPLIDHLQPTKGEPVAVPSTSIDLDGLLPASRTYWRYDGSLTTPPCTEGVAWLVLDQPVGISADQLATLRAALGDSARPVQPLDGRRVDHDTH